MTKKDLTIKQIAKIAVPILKKNGVKKAGIFGSYARGEAKKRSDIDILIQPPKGMGLAFVGLNLELEDKLGKKVDLLTYQSVSPYLKKYIMADEVRIL
ncbi:nucleotidyltransferase family protein [Candidatus Woesearchaeota archaeon]|nr:nucleotidyltransferase family protein [Candidatus Woesearchaeota archaeon]